MRGWLWLITTLTCAILTGCSPDYDSMAQQRLEYARQNKGDISIVALRDQYKSNYLNGVLLAAQMVNERPGKLLGRQLKVEIEQDGDSFEDTKNTIRRIAANPRITAVLGHRGSGLAVPASVVYERSQIIFISGFETSQELTGHNFQYVFRMLPNAQVMSEQIASVAQYLGYQNIVILYSRDDISRELAFLFEDAAVKRGINLVQNSSFFEKEDNYRPLIAQFRAKKFDAVFVASVPAAGGRMAKQLREMGVKQPILGSDNFNLPSYAETAEAAAENTLVPTIYRPNLKNPINTDFIKRYHEKYKEDPDYNAAQGYDSVMLLVAAIEKAQSTVPALLSSTMHYLPAQLGSSGLYAYNATGDLYGKHYVFNVWQNGQFRVLPAIHVPYLIERFEKHLAQRLMQPASASTTDATASESAPAVEVATSPPTAVTAANGDKDTSKKAAAQAEAADTMTPVPNAITPATVTAQAAANNEPVSVTTVVPSELQFSKIFNTPMHRDDRKVRLLELAQAIFHFNSIGLIYEDTDNGRAAADYDILQQMTKQRDVKLVGCDIPFSALTEKEIESELISCYGKLSINTDAIFIVNYSGISTELLTRLNTSMMFFKVPAIYIGDKPTIGGLDIVLNQRTDVDPQGRGNMEVYRPLLHNIKAHELAARLIGMPEIAINLHSLQYQGFADAPFLDLAPSEFMDTLTSTQQMPETVSVGPQP